ncbi:MAG: trigger factor [[Eubacterium] sulci]|jgi:trigger factor|nr:trigger factor [[Eubacterium] sulci]MBF1175796.1 trigger factor [[Eubacterium] sulci]MBF1180632.1 trigger factor [[Eubacterium] sulci]
MKATLISKENNRAKFTMDFTAEEFEAAVVKAYQDSKDKFNIDGFRKGKAPRSIIEKHFGEGVFFEDAINNLFQTAYPEALNELDLEVIDSPQADFSEIGKGKPLTVTIDVAVYPVVEVKDYKGIEVEQVDPEVTEEDVDRDIEAMRKRNSRMVVADRPVENGDTVILDYAGFVGDEQFQGGTAENQELKIGSGMFIPGFEEQLIGVKAGESKDVVVTFPEEYQAKELAGKEATFKCTVHEVKFEELPELDDEFAKDVSEFDTLDELRDDARARILESVKLQCENEAKDKVIAQVYENNKIEAPATMVADEMDRMIQELEQQMRYQGLNIQQYLQFTGSTLDDFRNEIKPEAEKRVATRIVLRSIGDVENVEVTDEDLDKELQRMSEAYNTDPENIKKMLGEENLAFFRKDIALTKVMDMLYNEAKITLVKAKDLEAKNAEEKSEEGKDK